jgi:3-hydroxyacyl-CoA dehydrogenase
MTSATQGVVLRRAAVLGSGVMGRAIAAHLANAGLEVLLLDLPSDGPDRNALLNEALHALPKDRPSPLYSRASLDRISVGNFEDDLDRLADAQWVIEAVVERFDIKEKLFASIAPHLAEDVILSTNTSGIPIARLAETVPEALRPRFLGTHFFNPPRYMHLLEVIGGPQTEPDVVAAIAHAGEFQLGKGVVVAKDRPNFVANRIGTYAVLRAVELMLEAELNPTEVDFLTGPLIGRPKSATFRTVDLVGLDTLLHVAGNVTEGAPDDPARSTFEPLPLLTRMVEKGLIGSKAGQGFYRKQKADGKSVIEALDLESLEYSGKPRARFPEIDPIRPIDDLEQRLSALFSAKGRGADYLWATTRDSLWYAASVAGEIADDLASIDRALRWGFGWKLGPFELWQTLGLSRVADRMKDDGVRLLLPGHRRWPHRIAHRRQRDPALAPTARRAGSARDPGRAPKDRVQRGRNPVGSRRRRPRSGVPLEDELDGRRHRPDGIARHRARRTRVRGDGRRQPG